MSEIKVSKLTNRAGTGAPNFSQGIKISGTASTLLAPTRTESATEPTSPANGDTWYDTDNDTYDVYINDEWKRFIGASADTGPAWVGDRAVAWGGNGTGANYQVQYFSISTSGNAADFGDTTAQYHVGASCCSDGSRVLGASNISSDTTIEYITTATTGNTTDFGELSFARSYSGSISNETYGVWVGGADGINKDIIDYVTVQTTGNAADFGNLSVGRHAIAGSNDATRGVAFGGYASALSNVIDYITVSTTGNATDFGDLITADRFYGDGCSDATRAIFGLGDYNRPEITYITVQTTGNATDFGDDTESTRERGGLASDGTYGCLIGGSGSNTISRVTIQTTGNAADHGDLSIATGMAGTASGAAS